MSQFQLIKNDVNGNPRYVTSCCRKGLKMRQPTFSTIPYKGYFILSDTMSPSEVRIAGSGYGVFASAKTIRGAKCKISRMLASEISVQQETSAYQVYWRSGWKRREGTC